MTVKLDRKEGVGYLSCKICSQAYQSKVTRMLGKDSCLPFAENPTDLTESIDVYSEWIDAADEAERGAQ